MVAVRKLTKVLSHYPVQQGTDGSDVFLLSPPLNCYKLFFNSDGIKTMESSLGNSTEISSDLAASWKFTEKPHLL